MATPAEVLSDPKFHALPTIEAKRKVMLAVDPRFGALDPSVQDDVIAKAAQRLVPSSDANKALSGTGLSAPDEWAKRPIPSELGPDQEISPWRDPTQGLIGQGVRQMGRGVAGLTREGLDPKLEAAQDIVGGAAKAAIPVGIGAAFPAIAANPIGTAAGIAGGAIAGGALGAIGRGASELLGGGPGIAGLTEQAGNAVGGALGFQGGNKVGTALPGAMTADPRIAINRSLRPTPSDPGFARRIPQTIAAVKEANPGYKPGVENGELNLPAASNRAIKVAQDALTPWLRRAEGTLVSGTPIVRATAAATQGMLPSEAGSAASLIQQAHEDYGHDFTPIELRARLTLLNKRIDSFQSQSPNKQSAALADIPEAVLKAQRDAVADTLYKHLDPEGNGLGPRLIQSHTGDLIALRDAALRRQNAILAEQPLTPLGRIVDPLKGAIRSMLPGKATGAGIAFAEGSEGRSLPMIRRAFSAVGEKPNALPQPGTELYPRDQNVQRQLSAGPPRMPEASGSSGDFSQPGKYAETEWPRLPAGPNVREMPPIPDTSGDRSWTGPQGPPPPFRQLPAGPQPAVDRQAPLHGGQGPTSIPLQQLVDQSGLTVKNAEPVIDPATGKILYYKSFGKGGVVAPKKKGKKRHWYPPQQKSAKPPQI